MSDLGIPQRFFDLAIQARGPRALSEVGLRERFGEPAAVEVGRGQVWRAHWEQVAVLVLVLAPAEREVLAVPVTIDPPAEDDRALVVDGASTAFGVDSTVWVGLAGDVPTRVLGRVVDAWGDQLVNWITEAARGRFGPTPAGTRQGRRIESELDSAAAFRAELADELELLRQAPGLPLETPGDAPRDLASLLGDKLDLVELCSSLGLRQSEVMKLLRGKTPLTPERIEVLARVTGLPAAKVASTVRPLPRRLVITMEHPRWRQTWLDRARHLEVSESEARLSAGYGAFAQAMRETGGGDADWDERLRQHLRDEQSGTGSA